MLRKNQFGRFKSVGDNLLKIAFASQHFAQQLHCIEATCPFSSSFPFCPLASPRNPNASLERNPKRQRQYRHQNGSSHHASIVNFCRKPRMSRPRMFGPQNHWKRKVLGHPYLNISKQQHNRWLFIFIMSVYTVVIMICFRFRLYHPCHKRRCWWKLFSCQHHHHCNHGCCLYRHIEISE